MNRTEISKRILGFDCTVTPGIHYLITNITPIFESLLRATDSAVDYHGFYPSAPFTKEGAPFRVIRIPPGSIIIDVLKTIGPYAASVGIVGLCGSLSERYPVSSFVCPSWVTESQAPDKRLPLNPKYLNGPCICQMDGLVQEEAFYRHLATLGIDLVDMESWYLRRFTPKDTPVHVCSVVSDMPLISPFYENQPFDIDIQTLISLL